MYTDTPSHDLGEDDCFEAWGVILSADVRSVHKE